MEKSKRKRIVLPLEKKLEIIKRLKQGESATKLAQEYHVGNATISDIKKSEDKLVRFTSNLDTGNAVSKLRCMRTAADEDLDKAVHLWFIQERSRGTPISGPLLIAKALFFNDKMNPGNELFKASTGWLKRFKERHGIRQLSIQGEILSANISSVEPFCLKLKEFIDMHNIGLAEIYNCDETGLFWRSLPTKTLASLKETSAPGYKMAKQRLTILTTANASGSHKLPLLVIGNAKHPRCFKHVNMTNLPVVYKSQKRAWMDSNLFREWFFEQFIPAVKHYQRSKGEELKTVLLIDNAPSHPSSDYLKSDNGLITTMFLPPNTTSLIQPMDQGILALLKRHYRKKFLSQLVENENQLDSLNDLIKKVNLKDVVYNVAESWDEISSTTIRNCWKKLIPIENETFDNEETESFDEIRNLAYQLPGDEALTDNDVTNWITSDSSEQGYEQLTDEAIITTVLRVPEVSEESESDDDDGQVVDVPSHSKVVEHFEECLKWLENQDDTESTQLMLLRQLQKKAIARRFRHLKQQTMKDFFLPNVSL